MLRKSYILFYYGATSNNYYRDLYARDLSSRLGRAVPPVESKRAWRKLTKEEREVRDSDGST